MKTYVVSLKSSREEVALFVRAMVLAEQCKSDEFRCIHGRLSGEKIVNLGKDSVPTLSGTEHNVGSCAKAPLDPPKFNHPV